MINSEHKHFIPTAAFVCMMLVLFAVLISQTAPQLPGQQHEMQFPPLPLSPDGLLHGVSGSITAVSGSTITVRGVLPGNSEPTTLRVSIIAATTITEQKEKDSQTLQKEMETFQKQLSAVMQSATATSTPAPPPIPPSPFISEPIKTSDLVVGMSVIVTPIVNTKQEATSFEAASISVRPVTTSLPTPPLPIIPVVQ